MDAQPVHEVRSRRLTEVSARVLDRRVARVEGQAGRAASVIHAIAIFGLIVTLSYTAFFITYDLQTLLGLVIADASFAVVYLVIVLLARLGRQFDAAMLLLAGAIVQLLVTTAFVGREAGFHLFLLLAAPLVFLMFTERQRMLRWAFAAVALGAFLVAQFTLPAATAAATLPPTVLAAMLSLNTLLVSSMLFILAGYTHVRAERARAAADQSAARAEYLANTDALTGLATRRPVLERLHALSVQTEEIYCLAVGDLDEFKAINDVHGHACGDAVLAAVGAPLREALRVTDSVGRWGGEEFIFVLPEASLDDAAVMMERIRSRVGSAPIGCGDHEHAITMSIGLTDGDHAGTPHIAITRADDALYAAKASGRDRVCVKAAAQAEAELPAGAPASFGARAAALAPAAAPARPRAS